MPTYFISGEEKIHSEREILHYNFHEKREIITTDWLTGSGTTLPATANLTGSAGPAVTRLAGSTDPAAAPLRILVTSGASCPDALVEAVIRKLAVYFGAEDTMETLVTTTKSS